MENVKILVGVFWLLALIVTFLLGRSNNIHMTVNSIGAAFTSADVSKALNLETDSASYKGNAAERSDGRTKDILGNRLALNFSGTACSSDTFREYYDKIGYFPIDGHWIRDPAGGGSQIFIPDMCKAAWKYPQKTDVFQCLMRANIKTVKIIGDAQAKAIFKSVLGLWFRLTGTACSLKKKERVIENGYVLDELFFVKVANPVLRRRIIGLRRPSNRSLGERYSCQGGDERSLDVEFIPLYTVDYRTGRSKNHLERSVARDTSAYLSDFLSHFLPSDNPDLIILSPAFNWFTREDPLKLAASIKDFVDVIQTHIPMTTKLVWIPPLQENPKDKISEHGLTVGSMKTRLFEAIKDNLLLKISHRYGCFDLGHVNNIPVGDGSNPLESWASSVVNIIVQMLKDE